jgi:hypothetical protein
MKHREEQVDFHGIKPGIVTLKASIFKVRSV